MPKAHGTRRDATKEQFWRKVVGGFDARRHTVWVWCARHGVSEPSFYAWRRELSRRDQAHRQSPRLLPVRVAATPGVPRQKVVVRLSGGVQLRVCVEQLAAVLDVLESRSC